MTGENARAARNYLIVSPHDLRTPRRVNVHFIAEQLGKRGKTRFFSIGFSLLSYLRGDPRLSIAGRAERIEQFHGIECFLGRTVWHPFNVRVAWLRWASRLLFKRYRQLVSDVFKRWVALSDTIILDSGIPAIFIAMIRQHNPKARIIYLASDLLDTVGFDPFVAEELSRTLSQLDEIVVPSRRMARAFRPHPNVRYVPHGLDASIADSGDPSPYDGGINAISVGSMLFDRGFFEIAAPAFPDVTFHIIGGGRHAENLAYANIRTYGEMPFAETLRYIKHAQVGIAPYNAEKAEDYLCDTSMKLMQYGFFRIPAVCPHVVVGDHAGRFGYVPGDPASIEQAVRGALAAGKISPPTILTWSEVTDRILSPQNYADTHP